MAPKYNSHHYLYYICYILNIVFCSPLHNSKVYITLPRFPPGTIPFNIKYHFFSLFMIPGVNSGPSFWKAFERVRR